MKRRALYPGSFDPITNGHLDVLLRARNLFDEVVVAVAANHNKKPLFSMDRRCELVEEAFAEVGISGRVIVFDGLLIDLAKEYEACAVIRGIRAVSDFEFEFQMALMNRKLSPTVETIFLMPHETCTYLSSSIVKELGRLGGDITPFVPACIVRALHKQWGRAL